MEYRCRTWNDDESVTQVFGTMSRCDVGQPTKGIVSHKIDWKHLMALLEKAFEIIVGEQKVKVSI